MALRNLGRHWRVGASIAAAVAAGGTVAYCEDPKTGVGFDPEALERGAKALREINKSPYAKKVQHGIAATLVAGFEGLGIFHITSQQNVSDA